MGEFCKGQGKGGIVKGILVKEDCGANRVEKARYTLVWGRGWTGGLEASSGAEGV